MFGLLNPFILWLAPLLAGPLIIHFLGRAEPKVRDFPSLLPVRGQLMRAMQRHRLKNWLQLILRTLLLLCLLLAAANLVWRSPGRWSPPESTGLLLHNGAYGAIPGLFDTQQRLRRSLDSLTPGRNTAELVIADAPPGRTVARFGRYPEAVSRLLRQTDAQTGINGTAATHLYLPIFDARDLNGLAEILKPWLERNPQRRVALIEYPDASLSPFSGVTADFSKEGQVTLRVLMNPGTEGKTVLWVPENGATRETRPGDAGNPPWAEIVLPLPESGTPGAENLSGAFAISNTGANTFAESLYTVNYHIPTAATLCVLAPRSGWVSRATLGEGGKRLKILPLLSSTDLQAAMCDLLYLADPENPDANLLGRAAAVLRAGGKVILGTGPHTDAALLNRNLLIPLGVGRLTGLETHASLAARAEDKALAQLGLRANSWGRVGAVRMHLGFTPGPGSAVLLSAKNGDAEVPLLIHHRAGAAGGELLLWTTDIGNAEWSDIGLGPWAALMHQSFLGRTWAAGAEFRGVDSDSTLFVAHTEDGGEARVIDPQGNLDSWTPEVGGGRAGPFDRTGLYQVEGGAIFAVNLATERLKPTEGKDEAWEGFYAALGEAGSAQTARINNPADWGTLYGGFSLRLTLLILAALLLFAEGVVSLRLSPFRN
jgi:hypothetical protein